MRSRRRRRAIESPSNELLISAATVWEIAIKSSLGRLRLSEPLESYLAEKLTQGYRMLSVTTTHAARVERLEWHHVTMNRGR